ncbi:hypothetical protein JH06_4976 [Blastocystis sp. subtype 4]|uniref:hypothetical protein n=1 Tax=Blastocystis sp. subtype 4 TaxID=944170 RepID=UPI000711A16D|nr:hypothetical protein JH06_4976 [Blastocystis sp. subtype 4]KNB41575.1 hypothetical protein JH06_4976 [Blastocystis sp. subtype 4]|eukprot:XP_014525018.1 hypothetical protein JH06_4976 [Blastocystis sp. subtype 4]
MTKRRNRPSTNTKKGCAPLITDVPTLLKNAQENIDTMKWKNALVFLKQALNIEPENVTVIDTMASVLMELGETDDAFPLLVKSAQMDPEHNFEKWMNLGQLQVIFVGSGNDAVTCYRKGIQLLEGEISQLPEGEDKLLLLNRLCGAYCSVGELYMTDL